MRFLVIFFAFCLYLVPNPYSLLPTISAHSQTQVIEMTPEGFAPSDVTVDENSTIIFLNKDARDRWPASNVHPTHQDYPDFDPRQAVRPGASWTFSIKKTGEWKYHDHLLPHMRGKIVVRSEGNTNAQSDGETQNIIERILLAIKQWFEGFINKFSREEAAKKWEEIKQKYKGQAGSEGDIHDQAHLAGSLIFKEKGFGGIGLCSAEFAFGCYHGFLDEAFKKDLNNLNEAYDACSKLGPGLTGPVASCIHGMGHGVASFHGSSDLKASLASCRKLISGSEYCFDGVFMEFARNAPVSFYKGTLEASLESDLSSFAYKKDDPLYPCNSLEEEFGPVYSFACGRNQPSLLMSRFKIGFDEVAGICRNAQSKPFKEACFDALGFALAGSRDENQIIQGCLRIGIPEYISKCAKAGAGELVFQEVPGWQEKSEAVCNAMPSGPDDCLKHLDRLILEYGRKKKINYQNYNKEEDMNAYLGREIKKCYDIGGKDGCYKDVADLLYSQFGLKKTLELLAENEGRVEVYARCHEVTHYLSRSEYERSGSISKVYAQCDSTCHGGCYHGTLEAYLKEKQLKDKVLANHFPAVCGKPDDYQKPLEFNECLHGMGHAAMFVTDMELKESLKLCDTISDQAQKERCYSGVFMENSSSSTSFDHQSKYIKADDPYYPCNHLEEKYQKLCWQYQSSHFSIISNQNWVKVAEMCLNVPQKYQDYCFLTIGTNQVGYTPSLQIMKEDCDLMPNEHFQNICVQGVISSFAYRFVGDVSKMSEFCSLVRFENKEACYRQVGTSFVDWTTDKGIASQNCSKIPDPQGISWCMSVI